MHTHTHAHSHAQLSPPPGPRAHEGRRLKIVLGLVVGYMVAEVIGALVTGSLALLADAGHMLSDAAALGLSLFAHWVAKWPPTPLRSYGYHRAEILAALANGASLVGIAVAILVEAAHRLGSTAEVQGAPMLGIAAGGLAVNLLCLWLLRPASGGSLNARGAWLHLLTDALGSVAAVAAGALIWARGWHWADPAASAGIALLVLASAWQLVKEAVAVLMESAPAHLDPRRVRAAIARLPGVAGVHDLHVWTITTGRDSLSAHVVPAPGSSAEDLLGRIRGALAADFGIRHVTIQIEPVACEGCGACEGDGHM